MRRLWILASLTSVAVVALAVSACSDSDSASPPAARDTSGPTSSGAVAPDTFMTFEGEEYELVEVLQADLISDEFTEIGVATAADIEYEGELKVYRWDGDDEAVYTYSGAADTVSDDGGVPAVWLKWVAVGGR